MLPLIRAHAAYERGSAIVDAEALFQALSEPSPLLFAWVAETQGRLIGYATATKEFSTWSGHQFLHLDCLFVQPAFRGTGVGTCLMGAVRAHALTAGICEMQWQTPTWNQDACRFYKRLGASAATKERFTWIIIDGTDAGLRAEGSL